MKIRDMNAAEISTMLDAINIGYLACALSNVPYVVPLRFVHNGGYLYALTTIGRKLDIMQINDNVCISFTEIKAVNDWKSLVVVGKFEDILKSIDGDSLHMFAHRLLSRTPEWWEPAYTRTVLRGKERPLVPVYFRVSILQATGHATVN